MKRSLLLLIVLVQGLLVAWAQPKVPREFQYGIIGGANLSSYTFNPSVTQDKSVGYTAGVAMRYIEEKYFGLQGEFLITRRDDSRDTKACEAGNNAISNSSSCNNA